MSPKFKRNILCLSCKKKKDFFYSGKKNGESAC